MVEMKPTSKMKSAIKKIEKYLNIKFTGKSFDEAKDFLNTYLPKLAEVDVMSTSEPTDKQLKGIKFIEAMCSVSFIGSTMRDASDFISRYLDEAKSKSSSFKKGKKGNDKSRSSRSSK